MVSILLIAILISFIVSFIGLRFWIDKCRKIGLLWEDMNKWDHPKNAVASGGIVVVVGFVLGVLFYVAILTFLMGENSLVYKEIFALMTVILLVAMVGLADDFLGWHNGGLSMRVRLGLAFLASIPLVVINAGQSTMVIPFFGSVNLGLIYPIILIHIGIEATTTVYNFLAGFNGLEAGQGILIVGFLSYISYITGSAWLALIGLCMVASLAAFWLFNRNPAKVLPGDVLTYAVGALIGTMAILGNFERIAFIVFIPYIIEMILKVRGKINLNNGKFPHAFGIPQKDGSLNLPYRKVYSWTHFSIWFLQKFKKKVFEDDVVYLIYIMQILFILFTILIM